MIYRKRVKKSGYSLSLLENNLKIEFGKRVLYIPFLGVGKKMHTLKHIIDTAKGGEVVAHVRRKDKVTVGKEDVVNAYEYGLLTGIETMSQLYKLDKVLSAQATGCANSGEGAEP